MPGSITLRNITRPEAAGFAVGDAALVSITGATANGEVTNTATLNGNPLGTTVYGQTNSFGEFYLVRTFGASESPTVAERFDLQLPKVSWTRM